MGGQGNSLAAQTLRDSIRKTQGVSGNWEEPGALLLALPRQGALGGGIGARTLILALLPG